MSYRTIPPAAAPIYPQDIISGVIGILLGKREIERFRSELKEHFGIKHCFLVSSGKAALTIILKALHELHPDRDEVLIPAFTCYSVPSAITRAGLIVKLCDVNPDTLDFDFDKLELAESSKLIADSSKLKAQSKKDDDNNLSTMSYQLSANTANRLLAIIPTHLFGLPADIDKLREVVEDPEITIVEDAAQAMGGEQGDKKLGTLGDVGFFSLGRGKAFSTVEGGVILTNSGELANCINKKIQDLPNYNIPETAVLFFYSIILMFLMHPLLFWIPKSLPFLKLGETTYDPDFKMKKMSSFQAGLAKCWQKKLKKFNKIRQHNSKHWATLIQSSKLKAQSSKLVSQSLERRARSRKDDEQLSTMSHELSSITYQLSTMSYELPPCIRFPVKIEDEKLRVDILKQSENLGLGIMPTYPDSINNIDEIKDQFNGQDFPNAKDLAKTLVTLPVHPFVSSTDKARTAGLLKNKIF